MDRRHRWIRFRKGKFTTRYICRVCEKRASAIHDFTGKISSMLKRSFLPRIVKQLNSDTPLLALFPRTGARV